MGKHHTGRLGIGLAGLGFLALFGLPLAAQVAGPVSREAVTLDPGQAYQMLDFLDAVARGEADRAHMDAVMRADGTGMIVGQMNLVRKVSPAQYREILTAMAEAREPVLEPVDGSRRAARGVRGLMREVWPGLRWGVEHVGLLRERVDHLAGIAFYPRARALASRFLPDSLRTVPRVLLVAGGRAGAAALGGECIYVDVLVYGHRGRRSGEFPDAAAIIRTVAHEMHHVGYGPYLHRRADSLALDGPEALLWDLLAGLMTDGSATYLISMDRDFRRMRETEPYRGYLADPGALVATADGLMTAVLDGRIPTGRDYEEAMADLVGSWFHSTGSFLLATIDEAFGDERIRAVVEDPRRLPAEYNRAVRWLDRPGLPTFDDAVAEAVLPSGATGASPGSALPRD